MIVSRNTFNGQLRKAFVALLFATSLAMANDPNGDLTVSSSTSGSLILVGKQGSAYKDIVFKDGGGRVHELFDGQYTYRDEGSRALSPDKKFYMVTQNESGVATSGSDSGKEHEVSSCAFIDTSSGCVVKKEVGEYCGGAWSGDHDWLRLDGESKPINSSLPSAAKLLSSYNNSIQDKKDIRSFVKYGSTVSNVMSCDAVTSANKDAYSDIVSALEKTGDTKGADQIKKALKTLGK
jgi:hypothetical protein